MWTHCNPHTFSYVWHWWECKTIMATLENRLAVPPKVTCRIMMGSSNSILDIYPKELKGGVQANTCILMFTAALFAIGKRWEQARCSSIGEWINKSRPFHAVECYSTIKRNEAPIYAATRMNLVWEPKWKKPVTRGHRQGGAKVGLQLWVQETAYSCIINYFIIFHNCKPTFAPLPPCAIWFHLYEMPRTGKSIERKSRPVVAGG